MSSKYWYFLYAFKFASVHQLSFFSVTFNTRRLVIVIRHAASGAMNPDFTSAFYQHCSEFASLAGITRHVSDLCDCRLNHELP